MGCKHLRVPIQLTKLADSRIQAHECFWFLGLIKTSVRIEEISTASLVLIDRERRVVSGGDYMTHRISTHVPCISTHGAVFDGIADASCGSRRHDIPYRRASNRIAKRDLLGVYVHRMNRWRICPVHPNRSVRRMATMDFNAFFAITFILIKSDQWTHGILKKI